MRAEANMAVLACKMWCVITTAQYVVGRKKVYISALTLVKSTDRFVAPNHVCALEGRLQSIRDREVREACFLRRATAAGGFRLQGDCMDSDEHTTEELGSLVSHGIEDHYPKFWDNPLSYFIYMHLLFYAKHSGPEKGRYIFETREISNLMCFGRKATGKEPSMHRGTITKAIKHLEKIGMIKILQKPSGKHSRLWRVEIKKYKNAWGSFRALFKAESPDSTVAISQPDSSTVANSQPENDYTKSCVASSRQKNPDSPNRVTRLTTKQTELFDTKHGAQANTGDEDLRSRTRDGRKSHNFNHDRLLTFEDPMISLSFETLRGGNIYSNIYSLFYSKRDKYNKEVNRLLVLLKEGNLDDLSSEEIISPDDAIAVTTALHEFTKDPKFDSKHFRNIDSVARGEFVRLYWNHIRHKGEMPFQSVKVIGKKRQDKLRKAFDDSQYFRETWAHALVRIRDSRHCRGATTRGWVANFDWFIRDETSVINIMEGKYDDRRSPEGRIKRVFDSGNETKGHLKSLPLSMVQPKDVEDWKRINPKSAKEARKQGLL